jgi:hypothetical protein
VNATVYGDAYAVENEGVRQVLSAPRLADGRELKLDDGLINRRFKSLQNVGKPYRYCWENTGESAGGTALAILRVDPIPSIAYVVRMEVWTRPLHLTYSHLTAPVALPVPLDMERHLVALCRWHLIGNEIFPEKPDTEMKADAAREAIEDQSPVAGRSQGKIFTPKGW